MSGLRQIVSLVFLLVSLFSCVPSPNIKLAEEAASRGDFEAAHDLYASALKEGAANKGAEAPLKQIRLQLTEQARQKAAANLQAAPTKNIAALKQSLSILEQAKRFDPDGSLLGNDIRNYKNSIVQIDENNRNLSAQANQLLAVGQFTDAKRNIDVIEQVDPSFAELPNLNQAYKSGYGGQLESMIFKFYADGDVERARTAMKTWQSLGFSQAEQDRLDSRIKHQEIKILTEQSEQLIRKNQFFKAFMAVNGSPYKADMQSLLARIKTNGARFYKDQAYKRLNWGNISRAYLESIKGKELNPNLPGVFEIHRDTRDQILERVQRYIAIPAFDSPKDNPDAGKQFSDALISYLFRILPYGINIVERGKIDILMQEHKREFTEVANILNVDLIVTGNVSLLKIDRQDNQRQSTVKAPIGEKLIINPEYELYIKTGGNTKANAKEPEKMIKVKEFGNFTITKGRSVVKGFADVSIRIFDTAKGRITYAQGFNSNYQADDDYQDALELAGIEGDPLTLPTDTEVQEKLRKQVVKQMADIIQKQFEKREKNFLKMAEYHMSRREMDKAIEELASGFLYCVKAKVPNGDPDFTEIRKKALDLTETDFL